jgi:recombinational DNA repair protein (RecF pathway)
MQGIIEEYRRRAKEYRRLAERAPEYSYAQYLIELALVYEQEALSSPGLVQAIQKVLVHNS